jgi:protein-S-isoprenylcysteine O-methyltransferase Ste14
MELIKLFLLGATGYSLAAMYDVAILYRKQHLKHLFSLGFILTVIPYPFVFQSYRSPLPVVARTVLLVLAGIFALLLLYSVVIEIALFARQPGKLYREGTYSICRHPGFLWFTTINVLASIYFWNFLIFLVCTGFTACNLALIAIEDIVLFPKMFPEYEEYKSRTPFLL